MPSAGRVLRGAFFEERIATVAFFRGSEGGDVDVGR